MNRTDLAARVGQKLGMDEKTADEAVKAVFAAITDALAEDEKVSIVGFGAFTAKTREAHAARNPADGEVVWVEESRCVTFKAGQTLKESLKG